MKAVDPTGSGAIPVKEAIQLLEATYGIAQQTARAWLKADPGEHYWHIQKHRRGRLVHLHGWRGVGQYLGAPARSFVAVPLEMWRGGPKARRCAIYQAEHQANMVVPPAPVGASPLANILSYRERLAQAKTRPTARRTLYEHTSFTENTQRAYERLAGVKVFRNYAKHPATRGMEPPHPYWWREGKGALYEQIGNSYRTNGLKTVGRRTMNALRSGLQQSTGDASTVRRYFNRPKTFVRSKAPQKLLYAGRTRAGSGVWEGLCAV